MKIIQTLSDKIAEEIEDASSYATLALENREEMPELAKTLYNISLQEMEHMKLLHGLVTDIIRQYRDEQGEPPAAMLAVYNYLHERQISAARDAKALQALYKGE